MSVTGCTEKQVWKIDWSKGNDSAAIGEEFQARQASEALRCAVTERLSMSIKIKEIKFSPSGLFVDMKSQK